MYSRKKTVLEGEQQARRSKAGSCPRVAISAALIAVVAAGGAAQARDVTDLLKAPINPRSGIPCPSPEVYSPLRPDPPGTPTVVGLDMIFQDISSFDDVAQTMTLDVYVILRWNDPRLADAGRGSGSADCPMPGGELWRPAVEPENLRSRDSYYGQRFLVDGNGTVTVAQRLLVEIANSLELHDFPFDSHRFTITLWPTVSRSEEVKFHALREELTLNRSQSALGWDFSTPNASVEEVERLGRMGVHSRYDVVIGMSRQWVFYALKLGVPLLLIVLMAYSVYFIPPSGIAQQVGVSMTAMLTLIAYMLALGSSLPKISYLTRADRLFVGCALLVFLGLVKAILTTSWVHKDAMSVIDRVDRVGRWLYPLVLVAVLLVGLAF